MTTEEDYREGRRKLLLAYCKVAKLRVPTARRIVGIATEPVGTDGASEDLVLLETHGEAWTQRHEEEAKQLQERLDLFAEETTTYQEIHGKEYPDVTPAAPARPMQQFRRPPQGLNRAQRRALKRKRHLTAKK